VPNPRFHGLFIGVDRYVDHRVPELRCAVRDAEALHALFVDTLGGASANLVTDGHATRSAIVDQFEGPLSAAAEDDLVIVTFSGHGSDDHFLLTTDANPDSLSTSSIHLDELVGLFAKVPANRILLIRDCCFSGGAGARVFRHTPTVRASRTLADALEALANHGRVILTACDPQQEAIEDSSLGHGLLTWFLMEGLKGPPDLVTNGAVPVLGLLQYVTQKVSDEAASVGHDQRPTMRGTIDGNFALPVLAPGALSASKFPDRTLPPVSSALDDLEPHGLPRFMIDAWGKGHSGTERASTSGDQRVWAAPRAEPSS
jgi:helicase